MKSNLVDIACEIVQEREKAIAVADGTMEEITYGHGLTNKRLKWFWLPRSAIEINDDGTITMPESLAVEKGLI
jgi:hypothetical protein